ncbi:unnamed protein product [Amaranthus hypochondriacus]
MPSTSNGYVPSQSIEMAEKIFQQLDKFTSKGKSPEKKFDVVGGSSIGKKTLEIRDGSPRKNMNTVDSLKVLQTKDIRKENVSLDSHSNALNHSPKTSQKAEEGKLKKISFVEDAAEAETPSKSLDNVNAQSSFSHQQKKRAFQMSAHEDFLDLDDDVLANGVASSPIVESDQLVKSPIFDNAPESARNSVGKTPSPEENPLTNMFGTNKESSLPDGRIPVSPSGSSAANTIAQSAVSSPMSPSAVDRTASQSEKSNKITALSSNSDKVVPFSFSSSPNVQSAAVKDMKTEFPSSASNAVVKSDDRDTTDKKRAFLFADKTKKIDSPSSTLSSAKGLFSSGVLSNGAALSNGSPISAPVTVSVSSLTEISSISKAQSLAPVSVSSTSFSFSSGNALSSSNAAGTVTTPTANNLSTSGSSSSHLSTSTTAPFLFGNSFQTGSSAPSSTAPSSTSSTVVTTSLESAAKSGAKSNETGFANVTSSLFTAQPSGTTSLSNDNSVFGTSAFKTTSSETQTAAPSVKNTFGVQAPSSGISVSTPISSFSSQSASSTSSPVFGLSGPASFSATVSTFSNPFTSGSTSASNVSSSSSAVSAPVSSGNNTPSGVFGWPSPNPAAPFGTTSQSSGFSFGLKPSESSTASKSTPIVFGATSSSSTASNSAPFVFGTSSPAASIFSAPSAMSTPAAPSTTFPSQPTFGSSTPQPFAFGSTPVGNNDQMSMEDSMAEDSVQVSTPAAPVFGAPISAPISAPSSGFVFGGAAPTPGNPFQFGGQQSQVGSQTTTPFQLTGSLETNAGGAGSFSLGSGGADNKSNRRFVRVKKGNRRK